MRVAERRCRGARFEACEHILARLRQIKTSEEIELLRRLSRIADQAITRRLARGQAGRLRDGHRRGS